MVRPGRPMHHVHNWKMRIVDMSELTHDERTGFDGFYAYQIWECVRGGKVKHTKLGRSTPFMPLDYMPLFTRKPVFLAMSGSPYISDEERGW